MTNRGTERQNGEFVRDQIPLDAFASAISD